MNEIPSTRGGRGEDGPYAADQLLPLVYDELRRLAAAKLEREGPGQTLQPTALVHEAYLKLAAGENRKFTDRRHFFLAAAEAMRRILVDRARRKASLKHGGGHRRQEFSENLLEDGHSHLDQILDVDCALQALEQRHEQAALLVKFRYFVGLSNEESAALLQVTPRQADRLWQLAKSWLYRWIRESE